MNFRNLTAACILGCASSGAFAQSQQQFVAALAGNWIVHDPAHAAPGERCQLTLSDTGENMLQADAIGCRAPLSGLNGWSIQGDSLALRGDDGAAIASLGGNQNRVTGELAASGRGIIVERQGGDSSTKALLRATQRHECVYRGVSTDCAKAEDLAPPRAEDSGATANIQLLANLSVRSQPRRDSVVLGTVQADACVVVDQCTTASDGSWCRARFGEVSAWLPQMALRQEEWPVITFVSGCDPAPEAPRPEPAE